jgi:hypothetical protein
MADLNPEIILGGMDSTHPVMAQTTLGAEQQGADIAATTADTALKQNQIPLVQAQAQQLGIANQVAANQLKTNQLIAQGMSNVAKHVQQGNPANTMPTAGGTPPSVAANNAVSDSANGIPYYLQANPDAPPPGQVNVLPIGVDPSWTADPKLNGYRDSDGNPVPHQDAPAQLPNGGLNYHSTDVMDAAADDAVAHGADPFLVAQWRMEAEQKALKLDQDRVGVYKDTADAAKATADAAEANARAGKAQQDHLTDTIYSDLSSPNPINGLTQTLTAYQNVGDHVLTSLGADPKQLGNNPGRAAYVQQFIQQNPDQVLQAARALQVQSPAYQKNQETSQAGLHIIQGYVDPSTGNYVAPSAIKSGPNGNVSAVPLTPGSGGAGAATNADGTPKLTPVQNYAQKVASYETDINSVPTKLRPAVVAQASQIEPNYDQTQYAAKKKALEDYTSGQDHQKVVAIQTAYNHLDQLQTAVSALNTSNNQLFNQVSQAYQRATGNSLPTTADAIKLVALDEVSKALTGGSGGEGDRETAQALVNLKNSPSQATDAINSLRGLMQSKVGPLQDAAKSAGLSDRQIQGVFGNLYRQPGPSGRVGDEGSPNTQATGNTNKPLAGQTPTAAQIFQFMQSNKMDHDTAIATLKAQGANL